MLVEQAAYAFEVWRGIKPPTKSVITAIRENTL
jgi:shikimate 5-dehydrogenase